MEPMTNYYFDKHHPLKPFLRGVAGNDPSKFSPPPDTTTQVPVPEKNDKGEWPGQWPCWDPAKAEWRMVEDHRGKSGYIDGRPTKIEDIGPLPAGWTATPPEPTPLEVQRQAESESLRRLAELDAQSTRSLRAIEVLTDMGDDGTAASLADEKSWLTDIEEQARTERVVLAAIRAKIAGLVGE